MDSRSWWILIVAADRAFGVCLCCCKRIIGWRFGFCSSFWLDNEALDLLPAWTCDLRSDNKFRPDSIYLVCTIQFSPWQFWSVLVCGFPEMGLIGGDLVSLHHFDWLDSNLELAICVWLMKFRPDSIYLVCTVQFPWQFWSVFVCGFPEIGLKV